MPPRKNWNVDALRLILVQWTMKANTKTWQKQSAKVVLCNNPIQESKILGGGGG